MMKRFLMFVTVSRFSISTSVADDCSPTPIETVTIDVSHGYVFKADIALLIDDSGSIGLDNYRKEIELCQNLVSGFNVNDDETRFALIWFSVDAKLETPWYDGNSSPKVTETLGSVDHGYGGDTKFCTSTQARARYGKRHSWQNTAHSLCFPFCTLRGRYI